MKTASVALLFGCSALLLAANARPASSQTAECLATVRLVTQPTIWGRITAYFASLSFADEITRNRSLLLQLRDKITEFEVKKRRLIAIVDAHIAGATAGAPVAEDLRLSKIPDLMTELQAIIGALRQLAGEKNLFVAQQAFDDLMISLSAEKAITLCSLQALANADFPDPVQLSSLLRELRVEQGAISAANRELGRFIAR